MFELFKGRTPRNHFGTVLQNLWELANFTRKLAILLSTSTYLEDLNREIQADCKHFVNFSHRFQLLA